MRFNEVLKARERCIQVNTWHLVPDKWLFFFCSQHFAESRRKKTLSRGRLCTPPAKRTRRVKFISFCALLTIHTTLAIYLQEEDLNYS